MKKRLRHLGIFCIIFFTNTFAQNLPPKREFRGAWVATVLNLDWPSAPGLDPQTQRGELIRLLDELQAAGINAVFFQIRSECDAMYVSSFEPWSFWLTGQQGRAPSPFYDPLHFAVQETHKRGMELHAWFNPYRAVREGGRYAVDPNHVSIKHPDWILTFPAYPNTTQKWLDPGLPEVRNYITSIVMEVVRRYDVDGVHFDDYFYVYPDARVNLPGIATQDDATFRNHPRGFASRSDWRRDNINLFVKMVHDSIRVVKPFVKFGLSPLGIWKSGVPAGTSGLDAYNAIYADAVAWLTMNIVDYIAPQLYWRFGGQQDYAKLLLWWASQAVSSHLYAGQGIYRLLPQDGDWPLGEVGEQLNFNRSTFGVQGNIFYRAEMIQQNIKGFSNLLKTEIYRYPALSPVMNWKETLPPNAPQNLRYERIAGTGSANLRWEAPPNDADGDTAFRYVVYRFDHAAVQSSEFNDPSKIVAIAGLSFNMPKTPLSNTPYYYAVTALDRNSNESLPTNAIMIAPPATALLASPANGAIIGTAGIALRWNYPNNAASYQLQVARDSTFTSSLLVNKVGLVDTFEVISGLANAITYYWRVQASNAGGTSAFSTTWRFKAIETTAVDETPRVPATLALYQNYPNPFNPITTIIFDLPKSGAPQLIIYDILGQEVMALLDETKPAGRHEAHFYAYDLPSGIYYYRLKFEGRVLTKKMTILKYK